MGRTNFENLRVYQLSETLGDSVWNIVMEWKFFEKVSLGKQLVRAADSIGANIAECTGRESNPDKRHFVRIARGSLYETKHWLRRAYKRNLLSAAQVKHLQTTIEELTRTLNGYYSSLRKTPT